MSVTTKTGDSGTTNFAGGVKMSKASPMMEAIGSVDELRAWIGLLVSQESQGCCDQAEALPADCLERLSEAQRLFIQNQDALTYAALVRGALAPLPDILFGVGALLYNADSADILWQIQQATRHCEAYVALSEACLPPLRCFIHFTGRAAETDVVRAVTRRAERACVASLEEGSERRVELLKFLNRLSDLLFCLARIQMQDEGIDPVPVSYSVFPKA